MTYTLYGCRRSGSLIVELALAEIKTQYDVIEVDLEVNAQRDDEYATVNPQRKVPTLITPTGETLTETVAILLTLDERHPEANLLPPISSPERAQALRSLLFIATEIYPIVEINDYPERFSSGPNNASDLREVAREIWRKRWLLVNDHIMGDPFYLSWGFCAVDIYIAVVSRWAQQESWRPKNIPKVEKLTQAVSARAQFAPIWNNHQPDRLPDRFE